MSPKGVGNDYKLVLTLARTRYIVFLLIQFF